MELTMQSAQRELDLLTKRIDRLELKLQDAKLDRDALVRTIEMFNPTPKPKRRRHPLAVEPDAVRGMEIEQALLFIAEHSDGHLASGPAREILVEAGSCGAGI